MTFSISAGYLPAFNQLSDNLAVIDVLVSFAVIASGSSYLYVRPQILDKGELL